MIHDTIAAIATAPGQGGIGVIRISGPKTQEIAQVLLGQIPKPRHAHFTKFVSASAETLDQGIALFFPQPHSFTGEDVLELHGHGGPIILGRIINAVLVAGARLAQPGEFSKRAFLNNKIDLLQAEAIADLIACQSEQAAKAAMRSLEGEFSNQIHQLVEKLITLRRHVEAAIDFPEEEIDFLADGLILNHLENLIREIESLQEKAQQGNTLREGITVVITGRPNAGKSSLLNALSGAENAIVTHIPGTTRDILKEKIFCDGMPIHIMDTAGIHDSNDLVEQEGIRRAIAALKKAEGILLVVDASTTDAPSIERQMTTINEWVETTVPVAVILNKCDLIDEAAQASLCHLLEDKAYSCIKISAKTHAGLDHLNTYLKSLAGMNHSLEDSFLARRRHLEAIAIAYQATLLARQQLIEFKAGELLAEELRQAQLALSAITGQFTADDLLGEIFSHFCIGK